MDRTTFPPTDGRTLRARREAAGVSMDAVAGYIGTTRQALRRWEANPALPYVKAHKYEDALEAAVTAAVAVA